MSGESHPFTVHDLLAMDRLADPQVSPDGSRIVFAVSVTDLERNKRRSDLWLVGVDGEGLRRLTSHESGSNSPRWSADGGSVLFLSSRSGSSQVWRIPVDGGEAERVTDLPLDVGAFVPAPDGRALVVALEVFPGASPAETKQRLDALEEQGKKGPSGRVFDRLFVRHWDQWSDGRRSHLFAVPIAGGDALDLMKGMDADCPGKPFGGTEELAISPDSRWVVFSARDAGREEAWSTNFDLYAVPLDGSKPPRNLTPGNPAWDTAPVFSPDGRMLAWLAMSVPGYEADRFRIMLRAWPEGETRELAAGWDSSPHQLLWAPDGRSLYAVAHSLGHNALFTLDATSGAVRTVVDRGTVKGAAAAGRRIVYTFEHANSPAELHSVQADGIDPRPLTRINAEKLAVVRMGEAEQFTFAGWNGETVHGWIVKPAGFDASKRYPVAFLIHGGPQGSFSNDFHYRWNPQVYAGAGYGVVMVDFHGSVGYGQAFTDSIQNDWGGKPLEDLQKGLEAALARCPWMDKDRVAALGASYGGYMINWILGVWPDRFRCLVTHDGFLDGRASYFDTEELWFPEREFQGTPWSNPDAYEKHNPIRFVKNWKTPTLVIHGGRDYRVVETQGLMAFTALQRLGVPSRFLHFPDENHWVLKPRNSMQWHETVLAWIDQWTKE